MRTFIHTMQLIAHSLCIANMQRRRWRWRLAWQNCFAQWSEYETQAEKTHGPHEDHCLIIKEGYIAQGKADQVKAAAAEAEEKRAGDRGCPAGIAITTKSTCPCCGTGTAEGQEASSKSCSSQEGGQACEAGRVACQAPGQIAAAQA